METDRTCAKKNEKHAKIASEGMKDDNVFHNTSQCFMFKQHPVLLFCEMNSTQCFLSLKWAAQRLQDDFYVALCQPKSFVVDHPSLLLSTTMVTIKQHFTIAFNGQKPVALSEDLVHEHEGTHCLRIRGSSIKLLQVLVQDVAKNGSLSGSPKLKELKSMRNHAFANSLDESGIFEDAPAKTKSRKLHQDQVVSMAVLGTETNILYPKFRGDTADILVEMQAPMLEAVFKFLLPDAESQQSEHSQERLAKRSKLL